MGVIEMLTGRFKKHPVTPAETTQPGQPGFGPGHARRPFGRLDEEAWGMPPRMKRHGVLREILNAWVEREVGKKLTELREMILEPNRGSAVKIERYSFGINTTVPLGVKGAPLTLTGQPDVNIRPQRVVMNAPSPGFAIIDEIKAANVSCTTGVQEDAFNYSALAVGVSLDLPTLSPANRATVLGEMTGRIPDGFGFKKPSHWDDGDEEETPPSPEEVLKGEESAPKPKKPRKFGTGESYLFTCSFIGPASIIG